MPGPNFRVSPVDCELLALTMSMQATPMFTPIDSASRPEISALDRAGRLEMQTHQKCPPRWITPLEYPLTRHRRAPASPLESALTKLVALKSFRFRTYIKHPGVPPCFLATLHAKTTMLEFTLRCLSSPSSLSASFPNTSAPFAAAKASGAGCKTCLSATTRP